jgi:hypothetical protein
LFCDYFVENNGIITRVFNFFFGSEFSTLKRKFEALEQTTDLNREHITKLRFETYEAITNLQVVLPDEHVEKTTKSSIKICDSNGISNGVGFYLKKNAIGTVLHNLFDPNDANVWKSSHIEQMITDGTAVFCGKNSSNANLVLSLSAFDIKYDFAVLKSDICSQSFLDISSCAELRNWFKGLAVTSFQIGPTVAIKDASIVEESFTVIPAVLLKKSERHILYSSNGILKGDSGGAVIHSIDGSVVAIHVEYFNEANDELNVNDVFSCSDVVSSINGLTSSAGGDYIGLRLDCDVVKTMLSNIT